MTELTTLDRRWIEMMRDWADDGLLPGRNDRPAALFDLYWEGEFAGDMDLLAVALEDAWTLAEFPLRLMDADLWEVFFSEFGFLDNSEAQQHVPDEVPVLYRAAAAGHERGMSWTDSYEQALWFYDRNVSYGFETVMLKVRPPRSLVFAHFHGEHGRDENEWVLSTAAADQAERIEVTR